MSDHGCKYCGRPRGGYPDPGGSIIRSCSPIDMPACQELLSQTPSGHLDSELCDTCFRAREEGWRSARRAFDELGQSEKGREELPGMLCEELQALKDNVDRLKDEVDRAVGQAAFDHRYLHRPPAR